jgi:hypothetical protein
VDDCLFFAPEQVDLDNMLSKLKKEQLEFVVENDAAGFLGIQITRDDDKISLTQPGLIDRIVETLGLQDANPVMTPAPREALGRDLDGVLFLGDFNYPSVVGMMMYVSNNTRPDIAFAVNQCARHTHRPTEKHARYLLQIGKYLKGTRDKGLIFKPCKNLSSLALDCYVDADFAGLWRAEDPHDPHCVRSRTGYIIMLAGCPVIWSSKLQTLISQSTMEAEYIALSTSC